MRLLFALLEQVPDSRTGNATRHNLLEVLTIALVASICGCAINGRPKRPTHGAGAGIDMPVQAHDHTTWQHKLNQSVRAARCSRPRRRQYPDRCRIDVQRLRHRL